MPKVALPACCSIRRHSALQLPKSPLCLAHSLLGDHTTLVPAWPSCSTRCKATRAFHSPRQDTLESSSSVPGPSPKPSDLSARISLLVGALQKLQREGKAEPRTAKPHQDHGGDPAVVSTQHGPGTSAQLPVEEKAANDPDNPAFWRIQGEATRQGLDSSAVRRVRLNLARRLTASRQKESSLGQDIELARALFSPRERAPAYYKRLVVRRNSVPDGAGAIRRLNPSPAKAHQERLFKFRLARARQRHLLTREIRPPAQPPQQAGFKRVLSFARLQLDRRPKKQPTLEKHVSMLQRHVELVQDLPPLLPRRPGRKFKLLTFLTTAQRRPKVWKQENDPRFRSLQLPRQQRLQSLKNKRKEVDQKPEPSGLKHKRIELDVRLVHRSLAELQAADGGSDIRTSLVKKRQRFPPRPISTPRTSDGPRKEKVSAEASPVAAAEVSGPPPEHTPKTETSKITPETEPPEPPFPTTRRLRLPGINDANLPCLSGGAASQRKAGLGLQYGSALPDAELDNPLVAMHHADAEESCLTYDDPPVSAHVAHWTPLEVALLAVRRRQARSVFQRRRRFEVRSAILLIKGWLTYPQKPAYQGASTRSLHDPDNGAASYKKVVFAGNHGFKTPLASFLRGGYQFDNVKFLKPTKQPQQASDVKPTTLDYQGRVVLPKSPGRLTFTGGTAARRIGGHEQYVRCRQETCADRSQAYQEHPRVPSLHHAEQGRESRQSRGRKGDLPHAESSRQLAAPLGRLRLVQDGPPHGRRRH